MQSQDVQILIDTKNISALAVELKQLRKQLERERCSCCIVKEIYEEQITCMDIENEHMDIDALRQRNKSLEQADKLMEELQLC